MKFNLLLGLSLMVVPTYVVTVKHEIKYVFTTKKKKESLNYGTHLITGGISKICLSATTTIGFLIGRTALHTFIGAIAGLYIVYKTPQWTDTYILKKETTRTGQQNIIAFVNRILLFYPLGVLTGEYFSHDIE
jgi:hypothetical protein